MSKRSRFCGYLGCLRSGRGHYSFLSRENRRHGLPFLLHAPDFRALRYRGWVRGLDSVLRACTRSLVGLGVVGDVGQLRIEVFRKRIVQPALLFRLFPQLLIDVYARIVICIVHYHTSIRTVISSPV